MIYSFLESCYLAEAALGGVLGVTVVSFSPFKASKDILLDVLSGLGNLSVFDLLGHNAA